MLYQKNLRVKDSKISMDNLINWDGRKIGNREMRDFAYQIFLSAYGLPIGQPSGLEKILPPKIKKFCGLVRNRT